MLYRNNYPVLEFDDAPDAKLNPSHFAGTKFDTDKLVITFFPEVIEKLLGRQAIREALVIPGENPVAIYRFADDPGVLLTLGQVGCPACAGNLDLFHAMGVTRVMFCGGGGVLDRNIEVGQVLLPVSRAVQGRLRGSRDQRGDPPLPGGKRRPLPAGPDMDHRRHFPGDARPDRASEGGRRENRGNGAGRLPRGRAVPRLPLRRADLRRRRSVRRGLVGPGLAEPGGRPVRPGTAVPEAPARPLTAGAVPPGTWPRGASCASETDPPSYRGGSVFVYLFMLPPPR